MPAFWFWAGAVLLLAVLPGGDPVVAVSDKIKHVIAFGGLSFLALLAWPALPRWRLFGLVAYGIVIEWVQGLTPTRQSEWMDVFADGLGVLFGWAAFRVMSAGLELLRGRRGG